MIDWPKFYRVLQRKSGKYLFSISLIYVMIVSSFNNACCFYIRLFLWVALGERSIRTDHSCIYVCI